MTTRIPSIISAILGCLCVAFAIWTQYVAVKIAAAVPGVGASFDDRYFWWPLLAGIGFWLVACFDPFTRNKPPGAGE